MPFSNNASTTTISQDSSGNNNHWTANNISVTAGAGNDSLTDTPTNYGTDTGAGGEVRGNYATLNPLDRDTAQGTISNGNLEWETAYVDNYAPIRATIGAASGKWYFEIVSQVLNGAGNDVPAVWTSFTGNLTGNSITANTITNHIGVNASTALNSIKFKTNGLSASLADGTTLFSGCTGSDVVGIAIDFDAGKIWVSKNGTWYNSGNPASGTNQTSTFTGNSATFIPAFEAVANSGGTNISKLAVNFGQRQWVYAAPSGFKALCTQNLPTPTITNGATAMDVKLYTGTGASQTISGLGFSPDFIWTKARSAANSHFLYDVLRVNAGSTPANKPYYLRTDTTAAESVSSGITSFDSNGFTLDGNSSTSTLNATYAAWCWDAGSSTVTNNSGTISSQVRASASNGFSVVTYTGIGANATVGHGLGVAPQMVIVKRRDTTGDWAVWHTSIAATNYLLLNSTIGSTSGTTYWNSTLPTSTVFSVGTATNTNANTGTYVAYCWTPVTGYSAFGSYTGNGSADGPMVFTNMRPRWIMLKRTDTTSNWTIIDTAREGYNVDNDPLYPNLADAEGITDLADILSNGFKLRSTDTSVNANAGTYIYACFAESPFALARAR